MQLHAELDWTPGGTPDMPYAIRQSRSKTVDVQAGYLLRDRTKVLLVQIDDAPGYAPYDRTPGQPAFSWTPWPLSNWVDSAAVLAPGETRKIKNRWVTRMTDDEIKALEPLHLTMGNPH